MGTKDYDSPFCRGLVFCTQFKNTFALSILTYPQKQHSQTGVCCICVCPQIIIPSGKSILLLGIFMPFGAVKGGQSHENNQYWNSCPCVSNTLYSTVQNNVKRCIYEGLNNEK